MCLEEKKLVRSHLIPAAVYNYCRTADSSPVRVGDGVIMHTDRQLQAFLLCSPCEDILNKGGENWVTPKLCTWERTFPLHDLIVSGAAAYEEASGGLYFAGQNPAIEVEKLTHFALGIFWKAAVHSWQGKKTSSLIDLGLHAEDIRLWLRAESDFPRQVCLSIVVSPPHRAQVVLNHPIEIPVETRGIFWFHVPGVAFTIRIGERIGPEMRMICFHENPVHPILVSDEVTQMIERRNVDHVRESRKTRGYLKQKVKRQNPR